VRTLLACSKDCRQDANVLINLIHVDALAMVASLPDYEFVVVDEVVGEITDPQQAAILQVAFTQNYLQKRESHRTGCPSAIRRVSAGDGSRRGRIARTRRRQRLVTFLVDAASRVRADLTGHKNVAEGVIDPEVRVAIRILIEQRKEPGLRCFGFYFVV
jgi:hypothetical protein